MAKAYANTDEMHIFYGFLMFFFVFLHVCMYLHVFSHSSTTKYIERSAKPFTIDVNSYESV